MTVPSSSPLRADPRSKPTLVVDFHGVINSYSSGDNSKGIAGDPPNPGAIEWLARISAAYHVAIISGSFSRPGQQGRMCMAAVKGYLQIHGLRLRITEDPDDSGDVYLTRTKPRCHLVIDDRCLTFTGTFPELAEIQAFKPWNR